MNCSNRTRLQLSWVLFFLSGIFLCALFQLNISARLNEPVQMPQVGKDPGEGSTERLEEVRVETGGLVEHLTTDRITLPMPAVPHTNTTAASKASNPAESPTAPTTTVPPKKPPTTLILHPTTDPPHINDKFPADLFTMAELRSGWVILHVFGMIYMFISLAVVCNEFFVPALEVIADKLSISEDVAGATVMAAGRSTPKLFCLLVGVFISPSTVAFGAIVGPAVFNILFVTGVCALLSRGVLHLSCWPLFRDVSFYIFDLILLSIFFLDNVMTQWESMVLVASYSLYMTFTMFNAQIQRAFKTHLCKNKYIITSITLQEPNKEAVPESGPGGSEDAEHDEEGCDKGINEERAIKGEKENERPLSLEWPDTLCKQASYLFLLPVIIPLWLTVPDVRKQKFRKFFVVTFLGSVLWICVFSYLMVWWAHQVCETIGISEGIMGLTILAAGTSIPDLITSVIVVRKGLGDMVVSSSVGSNIFNITVCLPVPWLLYSVIHSLAPAAVNNSGLPCAAVLLFIILLFFIISIASCKWRMNKALGFTMFLLYLSFVVLSLMFENHIVVCPVSVGTGN